MTSGEIQGHHVNPLGMIEHSGIEHVLAKTSEPHLVAMSTRQERGVPNWKEESQHVETAQERTMSAPDGEEQPPMRVVVGGWMRHNKSAMEKASAVLFPGELQQRQVGEFAKPVEPETVSRVSNKPQPARERQGKKRRGVTDPATQGTSAVEQEEEDEGHGRSFHLPPPEEEQRRPRLCCSVRLVISVMGLMAFFNGTLIRIGMVMAMVCMTHFRGRNVTVEDCPPLPGEDSSQLFEFSWSSSLQGFIKSGSFYGFLLGPFVSGFLSFRYGGKVVLIVGIFCSSLTYAVSPELARTSPYLLFGSRILSGFFGGMVYPAAIDILSHWAVPEERQLIVGGALIGVPLCSALNFPITGFLCMLFGWVSIFYFTTGFLFLYSFITYFIVYDHPQNCPYIKRSELDYLVSRTPGKSKNYKIPWHDIVRSIPLYAYIITHFCINYGFLTVILHLPVFMQDVYHFQIGSNSLLSAAPYLGALVIRTLTTFTFNIIKSRLHLTTTTLRKVFVVIGVSVPSFALIAVCFIPCRYRYAALACFIIFASTLELSITSGYLLSLIDMCPSYGNILSGLVNVIANCAGLLSAEFTGLITPNGTHEEWNTAFYVAIGSLIVAGMTYTTFGTSKLQPWGLARVSPEEELQRPIMSPSQT